MDGLSVQTILDVVEYAVAAIGIIIILSGVVLAAWQYLQFSIRKQLFLAHEGINEVRLNLSRILILGLEFIVAADLIHSVTAPDYYSVGLLAIIVAVRTLLSFSITREIASLSK